MWEQVDSCVVAGHGCLEDRAGWSGDLAWILDGASSVSTAQVTSAESDAQWLVERLDHHLRALAAEAVPLEKLVADAIERTAADAHLAWRQVPEVPPSAALGVLRRMGDRTEFVILADVSVIMRTDMGVHEFTDNRVDEANRPAYDAMAAASQVPGATFESARSVTVPLLAEARRTWMNKEHGYWVASVDKTVVDHAMTGALDGVREVVLASDGFMRAVHLFDLLEVEEVFDDSLASIAEWVRREEQADPHAKRFVRWSEFDDICALRLVWRD